MSRASDLARLWRESKCNICLYDLKTPITTEYGHNFCLYCLQIYAVNTQLREMVEMAQEIHKLESKRKSQEPSTRCDPIAQAASPHRERFRGTIKSLKKKIKEVQVLRHIQSKRTQVLRKQAEAQRQELTSDFEQNYISILRGLMSHMVVGRVLLRAEMLSTVKDFYQDSKSLRNPAIFPYSALQKVIQPFTANVTLDPESAHPQLRKNQHTSGSLIRFAKSPVVLGHPYFNSGRHFWEVKVGKKPGWAIGICKANLSIGARRSSIPQGCWRIVWHGACFDVSGKSHICTFRDTFDEPVCPYFYLGLHSEPLTLCSAIDSK
ncbi:Trim75 [Phodopus roborovskii]|uniref:Trim75 protein n=1 Tax=Phodopus roborovskii TaxID=109678 RepID=A0AAU9Z4Y9_PHORO|nr:Trim75 [Phodopus roborovskii]